MELEKKEAYNIPAEQALLGSVLTNNEAIYRIRSEEHTSELQSR